MTLEEFNKYLDTFNKNTWEYTEEEILEICSVYKLFVPTKLKNWNELLSRLGTNASIDAWDKRVARYLRAFPEYEHELRIKFGSSESEKHHLEDIIRHQTENLYKQQTKTRDLLNAYRRNMREDARIEDLKKTIQESAKSVETYVFAPVVFTDTVETSKNEAILLLSDWHIGALVDNFYNKFNSSIANIELSALVDQVKTYCSKFDVHKLNILNMGDLIHGGIHTNARIEQEFDVVTQVEVAGQLLYKVLASLEQAAPVVTYRSCSDNHSRLMPNKSEHIEKENFGRLIDWWVEAKLEQGNHKIEVIRDNLDFGLGKFYLLNGQVVAFAHGHEDSINQAFQNFIGATREFIDYALLAHYHNPKEKMFQDCRVIVNGSLVGTEQYALSKRLFSTPTQKLLIIDNNTFIDISLDVNNRKNKNEH